MGAALATPAGRLELESGQLRMAVRADLGGAIAGLWYGGSPVLRSTEPELLRGPRESACFPLVPYSNRLAFRRFEWQGRTHRTLTNFDGSPHSLHGVGWLRPWEVAARSREKLELAYRHEPDEHWPFAFEARQAFVLAPQGLCAELTLMNTDVADQPAGLGWHPYFPNRPGSRLLIDVNARWECDELQIPTLRVGHAGIDAEVAQLALDHCFEGWRGPALICSDQFVLRLDSNLRYVVVFTPARQGHFCVEPVSHVNDAIHFSDPAAHGLHCLRPGQSISARMTLDVEAL